MNCWVVESIDVKKNVTRTSVLLAQWKKLNLAIVERVKEILDVEQESKYSWENMLDTTIVSTSVKSKSTIQMQRKKENNSCL